MGWSFRKGATKQMVIEDRLRPWDTVSDGGEWGSPNGTRHHSVVLAWRCVGDSLWYVRETTTTAVDGTVTVLRWIGLSLLEASSYGWGWKSMDESMGPYDDSCPVEFLDMAPQPKGEYAAKWRENIRQKAAKHIEMHV